MGSLRVQVHVSNGNAKEFLLRSPKGTDLNLNTEPSEFGNDTHRQKTDAVENERGDAPLTNFDCLDPQTTHKNGRSPTIILGVKPIFQLEF